MTKNLVIVESPAKAKTLGKILGKTYILKASLGHVRDLPKSSLGVNVENDFEPKYVVPRTKNKVVRELKEAAKTATAVYLATDPDREGEAIAWHLEQVIRTDHIPYRRVAFHEITADAIEQAFKHPRAINMKLVNAQQARRVLDRLVGYRLSPLLWRKIRKGLSAGRVQSVAVRIIVDREREIEGFVAREYWTIEADLTRPSGKTVVFRALLVALANGTKLEINNAEEAEDIRAHLAGAAYSVSKVGSRKVNRQPAPPFITSTLQQEAWRKLHFTGERTMAIAQQLYEGLPVGNEGSVGLITYMRTDSTHVARQALNETRDFISEKYGADYVPAHARSFTRTVKGAQEAHEAIRPTRVHREPAHIRSYLTNDQYKLYDLIWKRMVASQMEAAVFKNTTVDIKAHPRSGHDYLLRSTSSVLEFPGFTALYTEGRDDAAGEEKGSKLPSLEKGDDLKLVKLFPEQHFTQPPPRYTEATLIKVLEQYGIGRPSTYAPTISTIQDRKYVVREKGSFRPTELGFTVTDLLIKYFSDIVDIAFTARMEEGLDQIASEDTNWVSAVRDFYGPFEKSLEDAARLISDRVDEKTDEPCPNCGKILVIKEGRYGRFLACSGYPECRFTRPLKEAGTPEVTDELCPNCGKPLAIKAGRFGKFLACTSYPGCKFTRAIQVKVGVKCPECGGEMLEKVSKNKRKFYGCANYPKCQFATYFRPLPKPCPECGELMRTYRVKWAKCSKCEYKVELEKFEKEPAANRRSR